MCYLCTGSKYVATDASGQSQRNGFSQLHNQEGDVASSGNDVYGQERSFSPQGRERSGRSQAASTSAFSGFGDDSKGMLPSSQHMTHHIWSKVRQ